MSSPFTLSEPSALKWFPAQQTRRRRSVEFPLSLSVQIHCISRVRKSRGQSTSTITPHGQTMGCLSMHCPSSPLSGTFISSPRFHFLCSCLRSFYHNPPSGTLQQLTPPPTPLQWSTAARGWEGDTQFPLTYHSFHLTLLPFLRISFCSKLLHHLDLCSGRAATLSSMPCSSRLLPGETWIYSHFYR